MKIYRVYYHDNYRCRKVKHLDIPISSKQAAIARAKRKLPETVVILNAFFNRMEVAK